MRDALELLVRQLEEQPSLLEPDRLRERLGALDRLDAYFAFLPDVPEVVPGVGSKDAELSLRARAVCARLEAANAALYGAIRGEIQLGRGRDALLRWVQSCSEEAGGVANGAGYDYLDELVSGVLQFEDPDAREAAREPEMVFYQPTPARHIFDLIGGNLIGGAGLSGEDVVVDLGSGLGHVPLLVSICTDARSIGIELEAAYVECARRCAQRLNVKRATFLCQDARTADLSGGTVFYLYTPFAGSILREVLDRLRREAATRRIRICTYGPCTSVVAKEPWLEATATPEMDRIVLFRSRD
ncbi:class I SAM-dependent methyltransferase [Tunturibacter empetritectus]|uniref:class I SAM-dependent methyltransferase n=1 Tax=Tunturiibacter empetritectus TaxID=3069691 RepID=UPI003341D86E